ncbi:MAG: WXG100 family type VII secretion target [Clostridiales bacterium]|jgi:WXG100 family type VII secretion target|nr:WXG100 family type VII secretion target [Clostridiales bacterium]
MAAQGTEVMTSKLRETANELTNYIAQYNAKIEKLYQIGAEIDNMWDGNASEKFMTSLHGERDKFNALAKTISRYAEVLEQEAKTYEKAESDAINVVSRR